MGSEGPDRTLDVMSVLFPGAISVLVLQKGIVIIGARVMVAWELRVVSE